MRRGEGFFFRADPVNLSLFTGKGIGDDMTDAAQAIAKALDAIHTAYWGACDAEGRAVDPDTLGAPDGLLDDAYDTALRIEELMAERSISWPEARQFL